MSSLYNDTWVVYIRYMAFSQENVPVADFLKFHNERKPQVSIKLEIKSCILKFWKTGYRDIFSADGPLLSYGICCHYTPAVICNTLWAGYMYGTQYRLVIPVLSPLVGCLYHGQSYVHGQHFSHNGCQSCVCLAGAVRCYTSLACPLPANIL